ncbi:MAG: sigma-70 family RNA polymerase sigma factor [Solirubrobacterales bacterium]|nr:sigma-70 family RNA polymerase sigma factor [Solirubrobacterales bacterium]
MEGTVVQELTTEPETARSDGSDGVAARKRAAVELIRSHGPVLRSTARRYSICTDDAEDAFQRGLEILLEKAPSTDLRELVPWARTVIKHEALAVRRERERMLCRPASIEPDQDWVDLIPSGREDIGEQVVGREKIARSREALARLKPNELKALTQLAEGYSYAEIGAMNDWTRTKVNRCLAEGRSSFRSAFRASETGDRCALVEPLLSACCDGELDRSRLTEVEDHLAACGRCRATLRTYRAAPRAAAALLPLLPASRGVWERIQELAVNLHGRLHAAIGDPAGAGVASGSARGTVPTAAVKLAAICAGTAGTAAVCVATGVLPAPMIPNRDGERTERRAEPTRTRPVAATAPVDVKSARAAVRTERPSARPATRPKPPPGRSEPVPGPAPAPTATETEFSPEAAGTPVPSGPVPTSTPAPAASPSGGSGGGVPVGGGGEFGP